MFMRRNFMKFLLGGMFSFFGINLLKPGRNNATAFGYNPEKFEMFSHECFSFGNVHSIVAVQDIVKASDIKRLMEAASAVSFCDPRQYDKLPYPYGDIRFRLVGVYPLEYILDDRKGFRPPLLGLRGKRLEVIALNVYRRVKIKKVLSKKT